MSKKQTENSKFNYVSSKISVNPSDASYGDFLFNRPEPLKQMIEQDINGVVYPNNAPPVFFGHDGLEDTSPGDSKENVICLIPTLQKPRILSDKGGMEKKEFS